MKKLLYSAAAMALAFFAASCQQESLEPTSGANTVTYTVQVPDAIATKAIGDEITAVDKVYYEVYRKADIEDLSKAPIYQGEEPVSNNSASFDLEFVKNQEFVVLFWAQDADLVYDATDNPTGMYDIDDLRQIQLVNPGASNNESAQVFAGKDEVSNCASAANGNVRLTRPVSQINVFTTKESLNLRGSQIILDKSSMTVSGMYNTYNVAAGAAVPESEYEAEYVYSLADVPETKDTDEYAYVAMNYVGFAYGENTIVNVDFTIKTDESGEISHSVSNVPVKPNYRTNIIGNLITSKTEYTIELNNSWGELAPVEVTVVTNAVALQEAIEEIPACGEIILDADINLGDLAALISTKATAASESLTIPTGKSIVLNLNGHSITGVDAETASFGLINNKGNLTITNSSSDASRIVLKATKDRVWNAYSSVISNNPGGNLLVKGNILIEHLGGTSMAYGIDNLTNGKGTSAIVTVDGASVKSTYRAIRQFLNGVEATNELYVKSGSKIYGPDNKSIWMQDPSKGANTGKLVVEEGAELYGNVYLTVTEGSTEWPVEVSIAASALQGESTVLSSNVPAGYEVKNINGIWIAGIKPVAQIGSTEYATLQEAFNVGGDITLLRDLTVAETVVLAEGKTVVLDLNGKTLSAADINVVKNNGGNMTIKNGTITRTGDVVGYSVNNASGEITVEDATIERGLYTSGSKLTATNANISHNQSSRHAIYSWNCEVTINSGTYHNDNAGNATLMASGSSVVTINGGTFSIADGRSTLGWTSCMIDQNGTAQVIVKGGILNGGFRINSANTTLTIEGGEFNTNNGSGYTYSSGTVVVKGGKFTDAGALAFAKKYVAEGYKVDGENVISIPKSNEIWYTSDEMALEPTNPDAINAKVVSNVWDRTTGKGIITFDAPLKTIGEKAFQRVTNTTSSNWATSITLPDGIEEIGNYAFSQCYCLTNIVIPDSVKSIGQYAFQSCDAVTSVTIGSGVTYIGSGAFYNCYEINNIICKSTKPADLADKWVFNGVPTSAQVIVPSASLDTYKAADVWKIFTNIIGQ